MLRMLASKQDWAGLVFSSGQRRICTKPPWLPGNDTVMGMVCPAVYVAWGGHGLSLKLDCSLELRSCGLNGSPQIPADEPSSHANREGNGPQWGLNAPTSRGGGAEQGSPRPLPNITGWTAAYNNNVQCT